MRYIKIDDDTYIEFDEERKTSNVLSKSKLENELAFYQNQLDNLPLPITDEELLAWARENHPQASVEKSRMLITAEIEKIESLLSKLV
ncbi:MAG: hypothetical protein QXP66_03850 [Candidatus Aenigmatarchaeota archaeon]